MSAADIMVKEILLWRVSDRESWAPAKFQIESLFGEWFESKVQ
jgi:hypothetical protein